MSGALVACTWQQLAPSVRILRLIAPFTGAGTGARFVLYEDVVMFCTQRATFTIFCTLSRVEGTP